MNKDKEEILKWLKNRYEAVLSERVRGGEASTEMSWHPQVLFFDQLSKAAPNLHPNGTANIMDISFGTYQPVLTIPRIYNIGTRCRVCAEIYSPNRDHHSRRCSKHDINAANEEVILGRVAVRW